MGEVPIRAIREISHDLTGRRSVRLTSGETISALDIQREYLGRAKAFVAAEGAHDPLHDTVLDLWERTLDAVESGDHAKVDAWRRADAEAATRARRPDLWAAYQRRGGEK